MIEKFKAFVKQDKIKNFLFFSSASFISAFVGVITLPLFTHHMPPSEFGIWSFTLTFNTFIASIIVLDLHSYFLIESSKNPEKKGELLSSLVTFSFCWSLVMIGIFILLGSICFDVFFREIDFYPYIAYILISNLFVGFSMFLQIVYRIENKPFLYFIFSIFQSLFAIFSSLLIVMYVFHDAHGRVMGYSFGMLLTGVVAALVLLTKYQFKFKINFDLIKKSLKFSTPLIPYAIAVLSMDFVDRVFIERYGGTEDLGLFGLANQINTIIYFIFVSLIRVYEPTIVVWVSKLENQRLNSFAIKYNLLLLVSSIGLMLLSELIIVLLTNEKYYDSIDMVIKLSPYFYLKSVSMLLLTILISGSKTFKTMYISLIMLGLYLLVGFLVIPHYGIDGMILVKTLVTAFGCAIIFLSMGHSKSFLKLILHVSISFILIFVLTFIILKFKFLS